MRTDISAREAFNLSEDHLLHIVVAVDGFIYTFVTEL